MLLNSLRIINSENNESVRVIKFHKGVNVVLDSESSSEHNKTGKTTLLRLIDIALGSKDKNSFYKDKDIESSSTSLSKFIENNKIKIELDVIDESKERNLHNVLCVELFKNGKHYINDVSMNSKDYTKELNKIFFKNDENIPSFRRLIKSFVRINMNDRDSQFLKNIPNCRTIDYRGIYNYLYDISDPAIDNKIGSLQKSINSLRNAEKEFKKLNNIESKISSEQIIRALNIENNSIKSQLNDINDKKYFLENRKKINDVRLQYTAISNQIADLRFQIKRNDDIMRDISDESKLGVNKSLTHDFFNEVKELIPNVHKTFTDLVKFNENMRNNKLTYLKEINDALEHKIVNLQKKREKIMDGNASLISIIENDKIDKYNELIAKLSDNNNIISKNEQLIDSLEEFSTKLKKSGDEINSLKSRNDNEKYQDKMDLFNKYFTPMAEKINNEKPILTYNPDENRFPLRIDNLYEGTSSGIKKSLIASYDLAYQCFAKYDNKSIPNFIVHDVIENIEGESLNSIIRIAKTMNSQYIFAVLKEKLDSSKISENEQEKMSIINLSKGNSLFKDR